MEQQNSPSPHRVVWFWWGIKPTASYILSTLSPLSETLSSHRTAFWGSNDLVPKVRAWHLVKNSINDSYETARSQAPHHKVGPEFPVLPNFLRNTCKCWRLSHSGRKSLGIFKFLALSCQQTGSADSTKQHSRLWKRGNNVTRPTEKLRRLKSELLFCDSLVFLC